MTLRGNLACVLALLCAVALYAGCLPEDETAPRIDSVRITPNEISRTGSAGMTDENFTITIQTANFTEPLEGATVTIASEGRSADSSVPPTINGDTIVITGVRLAWFEGLAEGEYAINAQVFSEGDLQTATETNVATVTVTP